MATFEMENYLSYEKLAVSSTAVAFAALPADANRALVICAGNDIRWRGSDANPTATDGMPLVVGQSVQLTGSDLSGYKFIRQAADATLHISYFQVS